MANTFKITRGVRKWYHKKFLLSWTTPETLAILPKKEIKKMIKKTLAELNKL